MLPLVCHRSGPWVFPTFIFFNLVLTSSPEISFTSHSLSFVFISLLSQRFSWLSKLTKYSFHLCFTFSSSISISPVLLLITLTCCKSLLCLFLCFAILNNFFFPTFVSSFSYSCCCCWCCPTPSEGWGHSFGAPEARQLSRAWNRGRRETESRQRASGAKSP